MTVSPSDAKVVYRPLERWTWPVTERRYASPFGKVTWGATLDFLAREVVQLDAELVVIEVDLTDDDLRMDGTPRERFTPDSPRVVVAFESKHGPMKLACDRFDEWRVNVRAVAKGLENLRRLDRYGIGSRAEQYTGFAQLTGGAMALGPAPMSRRDAALLLVKTAGPGWWAQEDPDIENAVGDATDMLLEHPDEQLDRCYKFAARNAHPDHGGNHEAMTQVAAARDILAR